MDFAYDTTGLGASIDISVPLSLIASNLTLVDTVDFSLDPINDQEFSGLLHLLVDNGFPLSSDIRMTFLDGNGVVVDSIVTTNVIQPGEVIGGRVENEVRTINTIPLDDVRFNNLAAARKLIFTVIFDSGSSTEYRQIYNDYTIDFTITSEILLK